MTWIDLHGPAGHPWHFTGLELAVATCFVVTLVDAVGRFRAGDRGGLLQWLIILAYGLMMELIAFHYWQNYAHATFGVQLYDGLLPLYVVLLYPSLHYLGIRAAERPGAHPVTTALAAGLAICLLDVPFDIAGVPAGWWVWADAADSVAPDVYAEAVRTRWLDVPVTSYLWYLVFGALLAGLSGRAARSVATRPVGWFFAVAPAVAAVTIVGGVLSFQVLFWLPRTLGVPDDVIVAGVGLIGLAAALSRKPSEERIPGGRRLAPWAIGLQGFMGLVLAWLAWKGALHDAVGRLTVAGIAMVVFAVVSGLVLVPGGRTASAVREGDAS